MSEHQSGGPASPSQPQSGHQPPPPPGHQPPPPPPGGGQTPPPPPGQQGYGQPGHQAPYSQPGQQAPYGQQPPYAQPAQPQSQVGQPADLMTRFLARLIDYVVLAITVWILAFILGLILVGAAITGAGSGLFDTFLITAITAVLGAALMLGYFAFLESSRGQTLGKMVMKIKTFGPTGGNPTMNEAVKRNIWVAAGALGIIPVVGSLLGGLISLGAMIYIAVTINNNVATRQGWHDGFAGGTTVIRVG